MVFGQMNEPPGARLRVALSALTMAEYFRDETGQDVLLFIDNIFRFTQAGSEVSALLGRMPSRRGLPADARHRDGRAAGAHHLDQEGLDHLRAGDLRAGRRPHRPGAGHHLRPPRRHHGALERRSRRRASTRPSTRSPPARASSTRASSARSTTRSPAACRRSCSATRTCRTSSPSSASTSSRRRTSVVVQRARKIERFLSQPFFVAEAVHRHAGQYVTLADTIRGFKEICRRQVGRPAGAGVLHGRHHRGGGREGQDARRRAGVRGTR